jgi:hypothetical protein
MSVMEIFRIWRKRWILTSFAVIIAVAASGASALKLPRTYQASSIVVLVPSNRAAKVLGDGNPYLSFSNALATTADVVATEVTAPQTARNLAAKGFSEQYTAVSESTTGQAVASGSVLPGPFVVVTVTGHNGELVEHTLYGVVDAISIEVDNMQAGVPRDNRISVSTLSFTPQANLSVSATERTLVLIIGLLIAGALCIPLIVDAQIARRRIRRGTTVQLRQHSVNGDTKIPPTRSTSTAFNRSSQDRRGAARRDLGPPPWAHGREEQNGGAWQEQSPSRRDASNR